MEKKIFSEHELTNIKNALKGWENVTFDKIQVIEGFGLCNRTYTVKALDPEVQPSAVFYRQFGAMLGTNDHEQENKIFKEIAKKGLGPQCYFANLEYRIEEYIPSQVIPVKELHTPKMSNFIAKWFAGLHKQDWDFLGADKNVTFILNRIDSRDLLRKAQNVLTTTEFNEEDQKIVEDLKTLVNEEEYQLLKDMLHKSDKTIRFCHNDANIGNIIKVETTGKPMLVDYELCGYNYRGFDIGAFFNLSRINLTHPEPPYYHIDDTKFSTDEEMKGFIRRYLLFYRHDWSTIDEEKALVDDEYLKEYVLKNDNLEDFEAEVEDILRESYAGSMLCSMHSMLALTNMEIKGLPYSKYIIAKAGYDFYIEFKQKAAASPVRS